MLLEHPFDEPTAIRIQLGAIFVSLELSRSTWLITSVSPGKGGLGTFAPPLDEAGNSVRGQLAAAFLSRRLGLDLFVSEPDAEV